MSSPFDGASFVRREFNGVEIYCGAKHSSKVDGKWQKSETDELAVLIQSNGQPTYYFRCPACGKQSTLLPKSFWQELIDSGIRPTRSKINEPAEYPDCSYRGCTNPGRHQHHTSPRNTFADCNNWPIVPLCESHHTLWHKTMNGYKWNSPRVAVEDPEEVALRLLTQELGARTY